MGPFLFLSSIRLLVPSIAPCAPRVVPTGAAQKRVADLDGSGWIDGALGTSDTPCALPRSFARSFAVSGGRPGPSPGEERRATSDPPLRTVAGSATKSSEPPDSAWIEIRAFGRMVRGRDRIQIVLGWRSGDGHTTPPQVRRE